MAIEHGATYKITGESGAVAVLNDDTDQNFIAYADVEAGGIAGLDAADVRESTVDVVEGDGAVHGSFYRGRRPITINVFFPQPPGQQLNWAIDRWLDATEALRADGTIEWTETGRETTMVWFRTQQPTRVTGRMPKRAQTQLVAARPRVFSKQLQTGGPSSSVSATNAGNAPASPLLRINGASTNPVVTHVASQKKITLAASIAGGHYWTVDVLEAMVYDDGGVLRDGALNALQSDWSIALLPGGNTFTLSGGGSLLVNWRDTWK